VTQLHICSDAQDLATRFAAASVEMIAAIVARTGRCALALSGGNTPRRVHQRLASTHRREIRWDAVDVFWGDERYVPADDPRSNYHMARETLLEHVACPAANVHPMPTDLASPDDAAREYERTLRRFFDAEWPRFDVLLLGLGADGHMASLFPGSPALQEHSRWVVAATAPTEPLVRLTLTPPAITAATRICVLVAGPDKAEALRHVLDETADPNAYPAAALRAAGERVSWWVDRAAASALPARRV
jgi:6-phosphogluconolactonase